MNSTFLPNIVISGCIETERTVKGKKEYIEMLR
jgi:hypothetical protein